MSKVLVVEDDWLVADELRQCLEELGASATIVNSSTAAMERISHERPAAVFLATHLGSDTCEVVLEECERHGIPVAIATAYSSGDLPEYAKGRPYLGKPFDPSEVAAVYGLLLGVATDR